MPDGHRGSLDTRLLWLWHQRFGTVQTVYSSSPDILDVTAATLILQAIMGRDLKSIQQLYQRLEGSAEHVWVRVGLHGEEVAGEQHQIGL